MKCRKLLAILLALVMVIGLLPFAALADGSQDNQPGYTQGADPNGEGNQEPEHHHTGDGSSVTWKELTAQDRQLTDGHYYLGNDITVRGTTDHISITGDVTLCLNSHALTSSVAQTSFIYVNDGGSLTLCDCGNGGKVESPCNSNCRVIFVREGGSCTIKSGTISGIDDTLNGQTIKVESGGSLTLNGGTVTGSIGIYNQGTTTVSGGTVACDKYGIHVGGNRGVVNMERGSVSATGTGSDKVSGIFMNYGSLVMTGGTVSGTTYGIELQTANKEKSFVISGGTITGGYGIYFNSEKCKSPLYLTGTPTLSTLHLSKPTALIFASKDGSAYSGGKVTVSLESGEKENAVIISGISNNTNKFTYAGGNFELKEDGNGNLILQTPTTAPEHKNHGVDGTNTVPQTWQPWTRATDLSSVTSGYYYLEENITHDGMVTIKSDADVHICLNGHTMSQSMLYVGDKASVTICDCKGNGEIIGGSTGALMLSGGSTVDFYSGTISSEATAAVNIALSNSEAQATFNMHGGTINSKKMGIHNSGGIVNVYGGTILFDVYAGILNFNARGIITIAGGTIQPQEDAARGDHGVYVSKGTLYLTGDAEISGLNGDIKINNPNAVYASKVDAAYSGEPLSVYFSGSATETAPIILDVTDGNAGKFTLVSPADKTLVRQGNNLVLTSEPAGHKAHDANGTGNIPAGNEWIVWDGTTQMNTAGYYYLDEDVTLTSTISVTKDVHLCLNGHKITVPDGSKVSAMFKIERSGKLSVCDCQEGGKIEMLRDGSNYMAIQVMTNRTFDLYSGTIYAAGYSRAVYSNGGTVNVSGGIIESASTINGALRADDSTAVVNLSGGEIKGAVTLRRGPKVYLSGSPKLTTINIKEESQVEKYAIQIHAASKDETAPYTGGAIEISTVETNLQPGHIVVYNVNGENASNFTLKDNKIVHEGNNLVIAADSAIDLTVTPPDFTYGDENAVIKVTTVPAKATVTFSRYIDAPGTLGTIDPNSGKLTGFDAGTFTVTVTATKEGYTAASEQVSFTVKKKDVTITPNNQTIDYEDGDIAQGADHVTASGLVNEDAVSEITLTADKSAKTITASNAVIKNGNRDVNKNYNISYAPGTLSFSNVPQEGFAITGQPKTVTYGDTFTLNTTGGSGTGAVTWSATGAATVDPDGNVTITGAGDFTITATKAGNDTYAEATATYQATAQKRALTINAHDATIAFNAAAPAYTAMVTGAVQADDTAIADAYTLTSTYVKGNPVGNYPITVTVNLSADLQAKYSVTANNGTLHVVETMAEVVQAPTAVENLVYTGAAQKLVTVGTATGGTMVYSLNGQDYDDAVPTGIKAGTYTVWYKVEGDGNHNDTAPQSIPISISKANLTVKANDLSINEGSPVPTYSAAYTGFVNGETEKVLTGTLTFTCSYPQNSKPGTYPITPSGLTSDNYAITFQKGTLTVVAVGEILPPVAKDLTYTGKAQKLIDPAKAADDVDLFYSLDGLNFSKTIPEAKNAGTYTVYWKAEKNGSTVDNGSLNVTIRKAPLTVTADDIWVYAGDAPKFTATIKGYVNGEDDWRVLKGELTFTCGYSEKYSKPGSRYAITPKGLTADNYDITFKTGTLTVKDPLSPRFNVYVLESKHGTVEADCRYARKGDVVTLTIKPDWGYELETLTVTDSHGYELKLTYHNNGTYTFTMPRDNVTVKAIFTVRDMPFVDVPGDAWYAGGVRYVYAHGLMNGTGNWHFSPNRTTTRAMIATILYRMEGSPRVYGTSQFGDVEVGSWYEDAVIWATQNDIVEGYTSKTFGPNDPITREQMAAMLYRYADYCRCDMSAGRYVDLSKFSDMDKISGYAIPALRWAVGEEIIEGRTGKRLAPTDTATRAEVAVMLMRFCEEVIW